LLFFLLLLILLQLLLVLLIQFPLTFSAGKHVFGRPHPILRRGSDALRAARASRAREREEGRVEIRIEGREKGYLVQVDRF
jgi:hypothetical protein